MLVDSNGVHDTRPVPAPAADSWVEVVGVYATPRQPAAGGDHTAAIEISSVTEVPRPDNEYAD